MPSNNTFCLRIIFLKKLLISSLLCGFVYNGQLLVTMATKKHDDCIKICVNIGHFFQQNHVGHDNRLVVKKRFS